MIFVTVGTHTAPFDRLIRWVDDIATRLDEPIVAQIGAAEYIPTHCQHFRFCTSEEIQNWLIQARVVVTHGGASIREIAEAERPIVVVPRLKRFREHADDHQLELAHLLAQRGQITMVMDASTLEKALRDATLPVGRLQPPEPLIQAVRESIERFG